MGLFKKWFKKKDKDIVLENVAEQVEEAVVEKEETAETSEKTTEQEEIVEISNSDESEAVNKELTVKAAELEDESEQIEIEEQDITVTESYFESKETITEETCEEFSGEESEIESLEADKIEVVDEESQVLEEKNEFKENISTIDEEDVSDETVIEEKPKGFFAKIKAGLNKTRDNIMSGVENVLKSFTKIDEDLFEELEEALIMADIGVETSVYIIDQLRDKIKNEKITDAADVKQALIKVINDLLVKDDTSLEIPSPTVILVIGVNGVGKTTTIGKLTHNYKNQGKNVLLAAADTFRAAAIDQLEVWAQRNDVDIIKHQENSDPGAVVFDAVQAAKARKSDILICDTAGRLHNKKNLMEELRKISKIIGKEFPDAHVETFLVLDATTGQNAIQQAKLFKEVADITGIVLTKLDGTAKGGIVLAIKNEMNIPVRYIGVGEGLDDLQPFNSAEFAKALFDE